MSTQALTSTNTLQESSTSHEQTQYTLWQVLGIWLAGSAPMWILSWVIAPIVIPYSPLHPAMTYWLLMIAGMAWQFVLSLAVIYQELGTSRWSAIRRRTWLQVPRDPRTQKPNPKLFLWLVPAIIFYGLVGFGLAKYLDAPVAWLFPTLHPAAYQDTNQLAALNLQGQWWLLGIAIASSLFNYFLGEEFLFRGVLLPKMQGAFGKYDWLANAVLFGLYHMHKPWGVPTNIVQSLVLTLPAKRFRSSWMAIAIHGTEGTLMFVGILAVLLGMTPG
jgi:membrane protease YdiL (CAAX protease family)